MQVFGSHFGDIRIYSNVYTGVGNTSSPINEFDPMNKEIYVGESIKWNNPTAGKPYPHTVTFFSNESNNVIRSKISNITRSFNSSNTESLIENMNKWMLALGNGDGSRTNTFNARSILLPSVINSSQSTIYYLDPSGNHVFKGAMYNMSRTESYLNSGLIWAGGDIPGNFSKIYSFTVTFKNTGTYNYQCLLHPGMKGTVVVKPNPGILGINVN